MTCRWLEITERSSQRRPTRPGVWHRLKDGNARSCSQGMLSHILLDTRASVPLVIEVLNLFMLNFLCVLPTCLVVYFTGGLTKSSRASQSHKDSRSHMRTEYMGNWSVKSLEVPSIVTCSEIERLWPLVLVDLIRSREQQVDEFLRSQSRSSLCMQPRFSYNVHSTTSVIESLRMRNSPSLVFWEGWLLEYAGRKGQSLNRTWEYFTAILD